MASVSPEILAYQDLIDGLVDANDDDHMSRSSSKLKTGCLEAYRQLANMRKWDYYKSVQKLHLKAKETFADVTYVAATRTWTSTAGSLPSWVQYADIVYGTEIYEVESASGQTWVSPARNAPDADISTDVSVSLQRTRYTLPAGFTSLSNPVSSSTRLDWDTYLPADEWLSRYKHFQAGSAWRAWTLMGDPILYGRMALAVYPLPTSDGTVDIMYTRAPGELPWTGYENSAYKGTVTGTAGATTLTATGHSLDSSHEGAMIRISRDQTLPTGLSGANPYTEQHIIKDVTGNTITLWTALVTSPSAQKFTVTSVIDVAPYMITAMRRLADYHAGAYLSKSSRKRDFEDAIREIKIAANVEGGMNSSQQMAGGGRVAAASRLRYLRA